jgi:ADP-ribosylglycohydrolase
MLGAMAGDIIGSVYERYPIKTVDFPLFSERSRFTDDTVLTLAVAQAILDGLPYGPTIKSFGRRYPHAGYGGSFRHWLQSASSQPYHSWGNGSAMRVSPVGLAFDDEETVLREAQRSAKVTHNHPEGIKGAQATALGIYLARTGAGRGAMRETLQRRFGYDLGRSLDEIRPGYRFDVSCQGSVPESIIAFLESDGVEDAIRKAISLGGDTDTMGCIAGALAEAHFGRVPLGLVDEVRKRLPAELWAIVEEFYRRFGPPGWDTLPGPEHDHG